MECSMYLSKSVDELWIELRTTSGQNDFYGFFVRNAFFVWTARYESIIHVGYRHNSPGQRNLLTFESVRVSFPIPVFMMRESHLSCEP